MRAEVLDIVATRGKMQNPVTGSGGMLIGTVAEVGPAVARSGCAVGDRVATLVSLSLTPLTITDGLAALGRPLRAGARAGHARSSSAAPSPPALPEDLSPDLALMVMDVCGAPALVARVVGEYVARAGVAPTVAVLGGAGKSGSLSLAAAAGRRGWPLHRRRARSSGRPTLLRGSGLADEVVIADARARSGSRRPWLPQAARPTSPSCASTCPGASSRAILSTAQGGTIIFFSMATSFAAAALGAEGLAADVRMLVGNGYVPGHADVALDLLRRTPAVRALFEGRLEAEHTRTP